MEGASAIGGMPSNAEPFKGDDEPHGALVRQGARTPEVVAFERALVSFFVQAADLLGVPKSVAAIYGICFASSEPLAFSEIQERLDISAGSISQGLRVLRDVGALKEASESSSMPLSALRDSRRRERFEPDLELRNLVLHFIEHRVDKQLTSGRSSLHLIVRQVPEMNNGSAKVLRARMKTLQTWHEKARAVLPVVKTFLKLT